MKNFGWKVGMLIFAGLMLLCILFGAFMIPLAPKKVLISSRIPTETKSAELVSASNQEGTTEVKEK
jgi:hypothetical protein